MGQVGIALSRYAPPFSGFLLGLLTITNVMLFRDFFSYGPHSSWLYFSFIQINLLLGHFPFTKQWVSLRFTLPLALVTMIFAFALGDAITAASRSSWFNGIAIGHLALLNILVFRIVSISLYSGFEKTEDRFGVLHGFAALSFALGLFSAHVLDQRWLVGLLGLAIPLAHWFCKGTPPEGRALHRKADSKQKKFFLFFVTSGALQAVAFQFMDEIIRPTGYEFGLWQLLFFLSLGLAPRIAKNRTSQSLAVCLYLSFLSATLLVWCLSLPFVSNSLALAGLTAAVPILLVSMISIPLFWTSSSVPTFENESPGLPLIWWSVIGNLIGLCLGKVTTILGIGPMIGLAILACAILALVTAHSGSKKIRLAIALTCGCALILISADKSLITRLHYSQYVRLDGRDSIQLVAQSRTMSGVTEIYNNNGTLNIWFGNYPSAVTSLREVHQALFAQPSLERGGKSILLLGLGNTLAAKALQSLIAEVTARNSDARITLDIVENNFAYLAPKTIAQIAHVSGFDPNAPHLRVFREDAFSWLFKGDSKYDAVVWNLSHPVAQGATRMYSEEAFEQLKTRVSSVGSFVMFFDAAMMHNPHLLCLFKKHFPVSRVFPGIADIQNTSRWIGVSDPEVTQWPIVGVQPDSKICSRLTPPRLTFNTMRFNLLHPRHTEASVNWMSTTGPFHIDSLEYEPPVAVRWSLFQAGIGLPTLNSSPSSAGKKPGGEITYSLSASLEPASPLRRYDPVLLDYLRRKLPDAKKNR